ncbi:ArdC-like ssDNA-binding domain-containing protein [Kitasatospora sp. NPDC127060]|uniref:ArdC-like ssDNA-binding domain-containing protein n=1 Tax=Kitasatospora sp. NPDC127060 TaxID=3347121 RepID=UPI003651531B
MARTASKRTARRSSLTVAEKAAKAAEREQLAEELHQQLTAAVMSLVTSEGWTAMLAQVAKAAGTEIGRYSANNMFMILMQCPQASAVCSYKQWQERGRQVVKGEKSIRIWAPMTVKKKDEETGEVATDKDGNEKKRTLFKLVPVFDVSQTEPVWQQPKDGLYFITPALPAPVKRFGADTPGEAPAEMWRSLEAYAVHHGYTVETGDTGLARGYARPSTKTVMISEKVTPAQAAVTLAHEVAGHVACGHTEDMGGHFRHRGQMETEADSVAHMVAAFYGVDATVKVAPYIGEWAGGESKDVERLLIATAENVRKAFRAFLEFRESPEAAAAMRPAQTPALGASETALADLAALAAL